MRSLMAGLLLLVLATIPAALVTLIDVPPTHAAACSMSPRPDPHARLASAINNWSDLVLIGVVIDETRVESDYSTPDMGDLKRSPDQSTDDDHAIYRSTVRTEAVLKGESPGNELQIPYLGDVWQCVGGPRLHEGSRVLLLLKQTPTWSNPSGPQGFIWQTSLLGGQILLEDGGAFMDDYQAREAPHHLGSADAVIRDVGARLEASPDAVDTALASAASPIPEIDKGIEWSAGLLIVSTVPMAVGLGLLLALLRYKLRMPA